MGRSLRRLVGAGLDVPGLLAAQELLLAVRIAKQRLGEGVPDEWLERMAVASEAALGHARAPPAMRPTSSQLQDLAETVAAHMAELRSAIAPLSQALDPGRVPQAGEQGCNRFDQHKRRQLARRVSDEGPRRKGLTQEMEAAAHVDIKLQDFGQEFTQALHGVGSASELGSRRSER